MLQASIIIPTYNRLQILKECLDSILNCRDQELILEIIVVDNNSEDGTGEFIKKYSKTHPKIKYASIQQPDAIKARNLGFNSAKGEVFIHIDDDIIVEPNWVSQLLRPYNDDSVGAVGGRLLSWNEEIKHKKSFLTGKVSPWGRFFTNFDTSNEREVDFLHGSNMSIRGELVKKIGGLDTRFKTNWRDDTDLCFQVKKLGFKLIYEPEAIAWHKAIGHGKRFGSTDKVYKYFWNRQYFYIKNISRARNAPFLPLFLLREVIYCLLILSPMKDLNLIKTGLTSIIQGISESLKLSLLK